MNASTAQALEQPRLSDGQALEQLDDRVRERLGLDALQIGDEEFEGLRDESPGREVSL